MDHFKFLLVMGPTELKKEVKARFDAWDEDKSGQLSKTEMMVRKDALQSVCLRGRVKWRERMRVMQTCSLDLQCCRTMSLCQMCITIR